MFRLFALILVVAFAMPAEALNLKGFVYDAESDKPLSKAKVSLMQGTRLVNETTTNSSGAFLLVVKKEKPYEIVVNRPGYKEMRKPWQPGSAILKFYLNRKQLSVSGLLVSAGNTPVAGGTVVASATGTDISSSVKTGAGGQFTIPVQPGKEYKLSFAGGSMGYADATIYISTVGSAGETDIRRKLVTRKIASTPVADGDEVIDPSALPEGYKVLKTKKFNDKRSKRLLDPNNPDTLFVINRDLKVTDVSAREQKLRERYIETIYFYAENVPDDFEPLAFEIPIIDELEEETVVTQAQIRTRETTTFIGKPVEGPTIERPTPDDGQLTEELEVDKVEAAPPAKPAAPARPAPPVVEVESIIETEVVEAPPAAKDLKEENVEVAKEEVEVVEARVEEKVEKAEVRIKKEEKKTTAQYKAQLEKSKAPPPPPPPATKGKLPYKANTVYFDKGKSLLSDEGRTVLNKAVARLQKEPTTRLILLAHTDTEIELSIESYLSKLRAEAVMDYITAQGVPFEQLEIRVVGSKQPAVKCEEPCAEKDSKLNRRVELNWLEKRPY